MSEGHEVFGQENIVFKIKIDIKFKINGFRFSLD